MRWSAPLSSKTDGPTVSPDGVHILNIHLHSIVCPHQSITMFKRLNPDKDVLQVQHHSHLLLEFTRSWLSLNNIAPSWSKHVCSSVYNQEVFFFHCQMLIHNFDGLWRLIIWFFLCTPAGLNALVFPFQGPLYCP
jgi:hypothetical protein